MLTKSMSFFGLKKTPEAVKSGAPGSRSVNPKPSLTINTTRQGHKAILVQDVEEDVITSVASFPNRQEILSGTKAVGGMKVPPELSEKVACFRITPRDAVVCYAAGSKPLVKNHLHAMRTELASMGLSASSQTLVVSQEVLSVIVKAEEEKKKVASNTTMNTSESAAMYRSWIREAHDLKATDLHMSITSGGRAEVMARVDGELEHLEDSKNGLTDRQVLNAMTAAYESLADRHSNNDGTFSSEKSMSCMFDSVLGIPNLRVRFTSLRGFFGPRAVSRLLTSDINQKPMSFGGMGFAPSQIEMFDKAQRMEDGMILQCGVTGSGKTTAAKTFLDTHPGNGHLCFYQVADPIEYLISGVHQIYVQRDVITLAEEGKKDSYSEVVENALRMDPDVLDLGEIRDLISARAAANVAKSGHLSMGTLHTKGIAGVLGRLTDPKLGLDRSELTAGSILSLLCYQALLPLVCEHCAFDFAGATQYHELQGEFKEGAYLGHVMKSLQKMPIDHDNFKFKNPQGCQSCRNRGTRGLTIAAELMIPDDEWLDDSRAGNDREAWYSYRQRYSNKNLTSDDMTGKSVQEHALYKAHKGICDPRQVGRFGLIEKMELLK